ncbi:MAG: hypothetical protein JKY54_00220, partial [Flavobacteriales bacterium]|nr:hypothetical protein [Flavobacteriales bacterium]
MKFLELHLNYMNTKIIKPPFPIAKIESIMPLDFENNFGQKEQSLIDNIDLESNVLALFEINSRKIERSKRNAYNLIFHFLEFHPKSAEALLRLAELKFFLNDISKTTYFIDRSGVFADLPEANELKIKIVECEVVMREKSYSNWELYSTISIPTLKDINDFISEQHSNIEYQICELDSSIDELELQSVIVNTPGQVLMQISTELNRINSLLDNIVVLIKHYVNCVEKGHLQKVIEIIVKDLPSSFHVELINKIFSYSIAKFPLNYHVWSKLGDLYAKYQFFESALNCKKQAHILLPADIDKKESQLINSYLYSMAKMCKRPEEYIPFIENNLRYYQESDPKRNQPDPLTGIQHVKRIVKKAIRYDARNEKQKLDLPAVLVSTLPKSGSTYLINIF